MKKLFSLLLLIALFVFIVPPASALPASSPDARQALDKAKNYLLTLEKKQGTLSPWSYIALAAAGEDLKNTSCLQACDTLSSDDDLKSGDTNAHCLLVFTLLTAGQDPYNYKEKNLVEAIRDAQLTSGKFADNIKEGGEELVNSHIWAVLALKAAGAFIADPEKARRWLASQQHEDGSFYWNARDRKTSDVDSTGMALMALGALGEDKESSVVQRAVAYLQKAQKANGVFESWGAENPESCSMVILGLTAVGIDPTGVAFQKPGGDLVTALLRFQLADGSFEHVKGGGASEIATYQALLALTDLLSGGTFFSRLSEREKLVVNRELKSFSVRFKVGEKRYMIYRSGREEGREMDVAPFIKDERTFVPVRYLAYALGVPDENIRWDRETKTVTLLLGATTVMLVVGEKALYLNGKPRLMDVTPVIVNNRTYLPAKFVAEAFGYKVNWTAATKEVLIIE